jgi:hypothetical protein
MLHMKVTEADVIGPRSCKFTSGTPIYSGAQGGVQRLTLRESAYLTLEISGHSREGREAPSCLFSIFPPYSVAIATFI